MFSQISLTPYIPNCRGSVMVGVLDSSVVERGFKRGSGKTKDYKIGICCSSLKQ